jgi:CMP-N-acetylneuraminic acid synthetase
MNARLQSSRVPQKLIRPFGGSTLIEIALYKLSRLDIFTNRYLAIAEEELAKFAQKFKNIEILWRDKLAVQKGVNPLEVTFKHYLKVPTDWVFVINPCQPLLSINTILKAYDIFQNTNYNSYMSAITIKDWIFDGEGNPLTYNNPKVLATDKTSPSFKVSHSFYIINKEYFRKTGLLWSFVKNDPFLISIPEEEARDVDTELEFEITELFYLKHKA